MTMQVQQLPLAKVVILLSLLWISRVRAQPSVAGDESMRKSNVTFCLYRHNSGPDEMSTDNPTSMRNSHFDRCAETIIVITGLNQIEDDPELIMAVKAMAVRYYNMIVVNFYTFSYVSEVKYTAKKIAHFIKTLEKYNGADPKHIILMGISLGAHIAGETGKMHKIGRIIALDPSGPIYDWFTRGKRLDSSDADFVEVTHSSNVYGTKKHMGHVDFIINGGLNQPNCKPFDFVCHHLRAAYVFLASITSCEIYFRQCFAYWAFKIGLCNSWPRLKFGLDLNTRKAKRIGGHYYYDTAKNDFPYCSKQEEKYPKLNPIFC